MIDAGEKRVSLKGNDGDPLFYLLKTFKGDIRCSISAWLALTSLWFWELSDRSCRQVILNTTCWPLRNVHRGSDNFWGLKGCQNISAVLVSMWSPKNWSCLKNELCIKQGQEESCEAIIEVISITYTALMMHYDNNVLLISIYLLVVNKSWHLKQIYFKY